MTDTNEKNTEMAQWTYHAEEMKLGGVNTPDATTLWTRKNKSGISDWDNIVKYGKEGWELVNSIPLTDIRGVTTKILFIFKRPQHL